MGIVEKEYQITDETWDVFFCSRWLALPLTSWVAKSNPRLLGGLVDWKKSHDGKYIAIRCH